MVGGLFGMLVGLCLAAPAGAEMVLDQPLTTTPEADSGFYSNDGSSTQTADRFLPFVDLRLTDVVWWGAYDDGSAPTGPSSFKIGVFPLPSRQPFTQITASVIGVDTGLRNADNWPVLRYETSLASMPTIPPGDYWFSIIEADLTDSVGWLWQFSDVGFRNSGQRIGFDTPFFTTPFIHENMAIQLSGVPAPAAVPEPGSLVLTSLAGLVVWRRSGRKQGGDE